MYHVKAILILLLENISHHEIYILIFFVVFDDEVGVPLALINKTSNKLNLFKN